MMSTTGKRWPSWNRSRRTHFLIAIALFLGLSAIAVSFYFSTRPDSPTEAERHAALIERNYWFKKNRAERRQSIWHRRARRDMPLVRSLDDAGVYVYYQEGKPTLLNFCFVGEVQHYQLRLVSQIPTVRTVSLENTDANGDALMELASALQLEELWLYGCKCITDDDLRHVVSLPRLRKLILSETNIGDDGLRHLTGAANLRSLCLHITQVTDAGLQYIAEMDQLEELSLGYTAISDRGLEKLSSMQSLRWLDVSDTAVTEAGIQRLTQALPLIDVTRRVD